MRVRIAVIATALVVLAVSVAPLGAQPARIMVYSSLHETEIAAMLDSFTRTTGVRAEFIRASSGELVARIRAERASPKGDIHLGGPADGHEVLVVDGLLEPHRSPEHKFIGPRFRDPKDRWHGFYIGALAIAVNKTRFEREMRPKGIDYPKKWEDLLNPAYKGEIVVANPFTSGTAMTFVAAHVLRLGADRGWKYLEDLDKNVNHYTRSGAAPARMSAVGEFLVGITFGHDILKPIAEGHPIHIVYPPDTGWEVGAVSIIKGGPNTAGARKFIDWQLSKDAGKLHSDISLRISVRSDVPVPKGAIPITEIQLLKGYDLWWVAQHRDALLRIWDSKFRR
ncbi:MAG: ABC transporter substrate-binding protein [bacterium]|nr:ABC transporter substrate-binding protein [bacterium]